MANTDSTPAIYVGTYGKYNSGSLAGAWLDLEDYVDRDEFYEAAKELHKDEADPELMFQDWEGIPDEFIHESGIDAAFWDYLEADGDPEAKQAFIDIRGYWDAAQFEESYQGEWDSKQSFAENLAEDMGLLDGMPENLQSYFDWDAWTRDLFLDGYTFADGQVFSDY